MPDPPAKGADDDDSENIRDWPRSSDAARVLGISVRTLRRREAKGLLHPRLDDEGHRRYDPAELHPQQRVPLAQHVPPQPATQSPPMLSGEGEIAARVFERLNAGMPPRQVVADLRQPPELVARLHRQWIAMGPDVVLTSLHRSALQRAGLAAFNNAEELIAHVQSLIPLIRAHVQLKYPCVICGKSVQLREEAWKDILSSNVLAGWGHAACIDSTRR